MAINRSREVRVGLAIPEYTHDPPRCTHVLYLELFSTTLIMKINAITLHIFEML